MNLILYTLLRKVIKNKGKGLGLLSIPMIFGVFKMLNKKS